MFTQRGKYCSDICRAEGRKRSLIKYNKSEKRKIVSARYNKTPKGKITQIILKNVDSNHNRVLPGSSSIARGRNLKLYVNTMYDDVMGSCNRAKKLSVKRMRVCDCS